MTAYWGWTQQPINQGLSNDTGYEGLLSDYTSKLNAMPSTESGGYLSKVPMPNVTYPTMPSYSLGRERALQQQYGAPAIADLDRKIQIALTTARNRPFPAQAYLTREALAGSGEARSRIMQSALNPAQRAQMQELEYEKSGLLGKYNADYQSSLLKYQQDYNTAMMKERERQSYINAINDFKLKQAMASYTKNRNIGASPAQAQVGLLAQMGRERGGGAETNPYWWAGKDSPSYQNYAKYGALTPTPTPAPTPTVNTTLQQTRDDYAKYLQDTFGGNTWNANG